MDKLGRNYFLKVQKLEGDYLEIRPPFTMDFDVSRTILSSANTSTIRVYNLSEANRSQIRKDTTDFDFNLNVVLQAGYQLNMPVIFQGNIKQAWSHRQRVDFITEIQSFDGGFAMVNGTSNQTFKTGTPNVNVLRSLINDLPGVTQGTVGAFPASTIRGAAYSGRTADLLSQLSGNSFFIDNGKANILGDDECLQGSIQVIDSSTGLLGTPIREQNMLHLETLFEPRLILGQKIQLKSSTAQNYNGFYRVVSIHHRGTISEATCGEAITTIGLAYGFNGLETIL